MDEALARQVYRRVECLLTSGATPVFPHHVDQILSRFAADVLGDDWASNADVVTRLKEAMDACLQDLVEPAVPAWTADKHMAYTLGLGPLHFHKVARALLDLLRTGPVSTSCPMRILDAGCGPGIASLSTLYVLDCIANAYDALDVLGEEGRIHALVTPLDASEEARELYNRLVWTYTPHFGNIAFEVQPALTCRLGEGDLTSVFGSETYDVILLAHVLSELRDQGLDWRAQLVVDLARFVAPGGSIIVVETTAPAGIHLVNQLKSRIVSKGLDMYGPCAHIGGKPAGPICFTCTLSRQEEIRPPPISRHFLGAIRGTSFRDLSARNAWAYGIFRPDGRIGHPGMDPPAARIADVARQAGTPAAQGHRANFTVQIAKVESSPFPHYKVCDQTAKTDDCYLTFPPDDPVLPFEVGDVLTLVDVLVDFARRPGGDKLKNSFFLVVDRTTKVELLTPRLGREGALLAPPG